MTIEQAQAAEGEKKTPSDNPFALQHKNIVLCSDGTGNAGGKGHGTNVYRIFEAVDIDGHRREPDKIPPQLVFYDDGVGTEDFKLFKLLGGAFGWGLSRNIRDLYKLLVSNYDADDNIYLFGFSRGAFTVRSLGGLITRIGVVNMAHAFTEEERREILVDAARVRLVGWILYRVLKRDVMALEQPDLIDSAVTAAFRRYRRRRLHAEPRLPRFLRLLLRWLASKLLPGFDAYPEELPEITDATRPAYFHKGVTIRCIGVWDTVGALGMPTEEMRRALQYFARFDFHSTELHESVRAAYHALAIDDERQTFHPVLWKEGEPKPNQRIEQVWFAGAHSNVGGGYPKQGMANVSLYWMMRHAMREDLVFYPEEVDRARRAANVNDKLYDPRSGLGGYYRYDPRDVDTLMRAHGVQTRARIHSSVFERIVSGVDGYAPANLPAQFDVVDDEGSCLKLEWTQTVKSYVAAHEAKLGELKAATQRIVDWRRWHYRVMLLFTFMLVGGMLDLRFHWRSALGEGVRELTGTDFFVPSAPLQQATVLDPISAATAWAVRLGRDLSTLILPEGSHRLVAPAFDYFAQNPPRVIGTTALILILLWLRQALRAQSDRTHAAFWQELRRKLREGTRESMPR